MKRYFLSAMMILLLAAVGAASAADLAATQRAAEQGDAEAQFDLGVMYDYGDGVAKDKAKAVYWYTKAAEQGNAEAQKALQEIIN